MKAVILSVALFMVLAAALAAIGARARAGEQPREPEYQVVKQYDDFELRRYDPYLVAETEVQASFTGAAYQAFGILAGYIGGNNVKQEDIPMTSPVSQEPSAGEGEKIPMTSPVIQRPAAEESEKIPMTSPVIQEPDPQGKDNGTYALSFVMPAYYTMENIPQPTDHRVRIREVPERLVAARRYSGTWSEKNYRKNESVLLQALEREGIETQGEPVYARYNPPWSLWFMRRNEVIIEVREKD